MTQLKLRRPDPREAKTLDEACANGDGTYDGYRLISWLSAVLTPYRVASPEEVKAIWAAEQAKRGKP